MIVDTGGNFTPPSNLINPNSLYWVLETIQHPVVFGNDPYPSLFDKAALLGWTIITRHVFVDGNKRTGMVAAHVFLLANDYFLSAADDEIEEIALRIVGNKQHNYTEKDFARWIEQHSAPFDLQGEK
jgi:death-on-curing protein